MAKPYVGNRAVVALFVTFLTFAVPSALFLSAAYVGIGMGLGVGVSLFVMRLVARKWPS